MTRALAFAFELALWIAVALIAATVFAGGETYSPGSPPACDDGGWHCDDASFGSAGI
jgi:hypothetical protein